MDWTAVSYWAETTGLVRQRNELVFGQAKSKSDSKVKMPEGSLCLHISFCQVTAGKPVKSPVTRRSLKCCKPSSVGGGRV